ncbi:small multi-drug export protein [Candidatus Peregrinibacteria bacterium]|nr:small multi-drug export protein [Candidatus Peregrinibacteria bacterium]
MSPHLKVFLAGMSPYLNLKLAIPLGISLHLSILEVLFFALAGDLIPALIILALLGPCASFLRKHFKFIDRLMEKLFNKTREEKFHRFQKYGAWGIVAFIATPLPGSGNVTGGIMAYLLGINYWKTVLIVVVGSTISALLIAGGVEGAVGLWKHFF